MESLRCLSQENIARAFEKAAEEITLEEGRLMRITEDHYEEALTCFREHFIDPLHDALSIKWGEETRAMHLDVLRHNMSLMIVNDATGDPISVLSIRVERKGESHSDESFQDEMLRKIWIYVDECESRAGLFDHFNVDGAIQLAFLVTKRKYRRRGYGAKIVGAAFTLIRNLELGKVCVKGEASSAFVNKVFEKEGMQCLLECMYDEYEVDGEKLFKNLGEHKSMNIYGMIVNASKTV